MYYANLIIDDLNIQAWGESLEGEPTRIDINGIITPDHFNFIFYEQIKTEWQQKAVEVPF